MDTKKISRRRFVKGSLSALALSALPLKTALGQTTWTRLEWQQYRTTPQYGQFINAIRTMRANTNASDPNSWAYWSNLHVNSCPHGVPYFLSWHRAYIYEFEQRLRIVSGNSGLTLPYWNYFANANLPADFTDPATSNPLYVPRSNTNVYNALSLWAFAPEIVNFQTGTSNAFEDLVQWAPHNGIHNILGGVMSGMQAPLDPIFWLHHANIDRLWHAWALPDGKNMPWWQDPYWSGTYNFGTNMTVQRSSTYHIAWLNYTYDNLNKPTSLPPNAQAAKIIRVQARVGDMGGVPAVVPFAPTGPKTIGDNRLSLGGARSIALGDASASIRISLDSAGSKQMQSILAKVRREPDLTASPYKSVQIVLDEVNLMGSAKDAGFFYYVYVNLPAGFNAATSGQRYLVGTIGAFEIAGAAHHGPATFSFPATMQLADIGEGVLQDVTVSLVRVNGSNAPKEKVAVTISEIRVEVSTNEPAIAPGRLKPASECYC